MFLPCCYPSGSCLVYIDYQITFKIRRTFLSHITLFGRSIYVSIFLFSRYSCVQYCNVIFFCNFSLPVTCHPLPSFFQSSKPIASSSDSSVCLYTFLSVNFFMLVISPIILWTFSFIWLFGLLLVMIIPRSFSLSALVILSHLTCIGIDVSF